MPNQSFKLYTDDAYDGMVAYTSEPTVIVSMIAGEPMPYGQSVRQSSSIEDEAVASSGTSNIHGIVIRDINHESANRPSDGTITFKKGDKISVLRQGTIWVEVQINGNRRDAALDSGRPGVLPSNGRLSAFYRAGLVFGSKNLTWLRGAPVGQLGLLRIDIGTPNNYAAE